MKVYRNVRKTHYFLSEKKSQPSASTSSINAAEQAEPDVEILPACQEAKSSNQAIVASSSSSSLNQHGADPDSSSSNTIDTMHTKRLT